MTTIYKFPAGYTKGGVATAPSSAPTVQVIDNANNILVAALTAVTAYTNQPGSYYYEYSGADNLTCWALFHTSDETVDQKDQWSYTPSQIYVGNLNIATILADYARRTGDYATAAALSTAQGNLTTILADYARRTGDYSTLAAGAQMDLVNAPNATAITAIKSGLALEATLTAIKGAGWTTETLAAIDVLIDAIKAKTDNLPTDPADHSLIMAAIGVISGPGITSWPYTVTDSLAVPITGVRVWVTTDIVGVNVVASGYTNALGTVTFLLDAGTYYIWCQKAGYNFQNPDLEVVV